MIRHFLRPTECCLVAAAVLAGDRAGAQRRSPPDAVLSWGAGAAMLTEHQEE